MSNELVIPWEEAFALHPEKREAILATLLPSDPKYKVFHALHKVASMGPDDKIPPELDDVLRETERGSLSSYYGEYRGLLDHLVARGMLAKFLDCENSELRDGVMNKLDVRVNHQPVEVAAAVKEEKPAHPSCVAVPTPAEWKGMLTTQNEKNDRCYEYVDVKKLPRDELLAYVRDITNSGRGDVTNVLDAVLALAKPAKAKAKQEGNKAAAVTLSSDLRKVNLSQLFRQLTQEQLDCLADSNPAFGKDENFVAASVAKIMFRHVSAPADKTSPEFQTSIKEVYDYSRTLPETYGEIQLQALFALLEHAERSGGMDDQQVKDWFVEYISFIRSTAPWSENAPGKRPVVVQKQSKSKYKSKKAAAPRKKMSKRQNIKERFSKKVGRHHEEEYDPSESEEDDEAADVDVTRLLGGEARRSRKVSFSRLRIPLVEFSESADLALVERYLAHYMTADAENEDLQPYADYMNRTWLLKFQAKAKLFAGQGDATQWCDELGDDSVVQRLKDTVEIQFDPGNPHRFRADDDVSLQVTVKNVEKLIVKVFEVNAETYYRNHLAQINTSLDLDGLVASEEQLISVGAKSPMLRTRQTLKFPRLKGSRGVFVIDVIGNGTSSRAVVRKGWYNYVERATSAGHMLTILDEDGAVLRDAVVTLNRRQYTTEAGGDQETGEILVPYGTSSGTHSVVISHGGFAVLERLTVRAEQYTFVAGMFVDREQLLPSVECTIIVRPQLFTGNVPVPLACVTSLQLTVTGSTHKGTTMKKNFSLTERLHELCEDGRPEELVAAFMIPPACASITCQLTARIQHTATDETRPYSVSETFEVGDKATTAQIEDSFMQAGNGQYYVYVLGRAGEPIPHRRCTIQFDHRWFNLSAHLDACTDAKGRVKIDCGRVGDRKHRDPLLAVARIQETMTRNAWEVEHPDVVRCTHPSAVHQEAGKPVDVVLPSSASAHQYGLTGEQLFALLRVDDHDAGVVLSDASSYVKVSPPYLRLGADLPPGAYTLVIKYPSAPIVKVSVRIARGTPLSAGAFLVTPSSCLGLKPEHTAPLAVASATTVGKDLVVRVAHATPRTRVHVVATHFLAPFPLHRQLDMTSMVAPARSTFALPTNDYITGRELGDEYRYILDRKYLPKYAGSLAPKPTALAHPWVVSEHGESKGFAKDGDNYGASAQQHMQQRMEGKLKMKEKVTLRHSSVCDFMDATSGVLVNLRPNADGVVKVPWAHLPKKCTLVHVVVVDGDQCVGVTQIAPGKKPGFGRCPLVLSAEEALDPALHYTEELRVTTLRGGETYDASGATKVEVFDSLHKVFQYFSVMCEELSPKFEHFVKWPTFDEAKKVELYDDLASHELHFFLLHRDRAFFDAHVLPVLRAKRTRTLLDHFFLRDTAALERYLAPYHFESLNILEKILLCASVGRLDVLVRLLRDILRTDFRPDTNAVAHRFELALNMSEMEPGAGAGGGAGGGGGGAFARAAMMPMLSKNSKRRARQASMCLNRFDSCDFTMQQEMDVLPVSCALMDSCSESYCDSDEECEEMCDDDDDDEFDDFSYNEQKQFEKKDRKEVQLRDRARQTRQTMYKIQAKTKQLEERGYLGRSIAADTKGLVTPSKFWLDYAEYLLESKASLNVATPADVLWSEARAPFVSSSLHTLALGGSAVTTQWLAALSVLDLPLDANAGRRFADVQYGPTGAVKAVVAEATRPALVFHRDLQPTEADPDSAPPSADGVLRASVDDTEPSPAVGLVRDVLITQTLMDAKDQVGEMGEEKYLGPNHEFVPGHEYICKVIMTNTSSQAKELKLLVQVPVGSLPLRTPKQTGGGTFNLQPFTTQSHQFSFYFPAEGPAFPQFPAHVSLKGVPVSWAEPRVYTVVRRPTTVSKSWKNIARYGTDEEVLAYLQDANLMHDRTRYAFFRLREKAFYRKAVELFRSRLVFSREVWGYSFLHDDRQAMREFVEAYPGLRNLVGVGVLNVTAARVDPQERLWYVPAEFDPLVEARAHQLGADRKLLNDGLRAHYKNFLQKLCFQRELSAADAAAAVYYLFLMNRDHEAVTMFEKHLADGAGAGEEAPFESYLRAYVAARCGNVVAVKETCARFADHPVPRIREHFRSLAAHVDAEATPLGEGAVVKGVLTAPRLEVEVGSEYTIRIRHARLPPTVTVNYYVMDIELLFSTAPFSMTSENTSKFAYVVPTLSETVALAGGSDPEKKKKKKHDSKAEAKKKHDSKAEVKGADSSVASKGTIVHKLPKDFHGANLMIDVTTPGLSRSIPYFAHRLDITVAESFGQIQVRDKDSKAPIPKAYLKVYSNPGARFYKDGYTDVRGVFDYAALTNEKLRTVTRFAILVISPDHGAVVREVSPPALG